MDYLKTYIYLIVAIKLLFIILGIYNLYLKRSIAKKSKKDDVAKQQKVEFWKDRIEFIFVFLMSILLIYLFNPRFNNARLINSETKTLLCLFGFVLLLTAKWSTFFKESRSFKKIQSVLGRNDQTPQ